MLKLSEASDLIKELKEKYQTYRTNGLVEAAFDSTASAITRIQNDRLDDTGSIFGTYSVNYFKSKKAKLSSDNRINYTETNLMFSTTLPQVLEVTRDNVVIIIAPTNENRKEVMSYHDERHGRPIMTLSILEQEEIIENYNQGFKEDCLDRLGLTAA